MQLSKKEFCLFKKLLILLYILISVNIPSFASELGQNINGILNSFDFDRDSVVSISVKDRKTGANVYEKSSHKFLNPASTLKLFTMAASVDTLGENYSFDTAFYKDKKNNLYLKLSANPILKSSDLDTLSENLKKNLKGKINRIYIDDSIIDKLPYPKGWMEDDFWPNSPKISPYTVDKNTVSIDIFLNQDKKGMRIIQKSPYKFSFVNNLKISDKTDIHFIQDDTHNTVNLEGEISESVLNKKLPVINPKYFFIQNLINSLDKSGITYNEKFLDGKTPNDAILVAKVSSPIKEVVKYILETSDNEAAETIFKVAGGVYAKKVTSIKTDMNTFGTTQNGINMFNSYFENLGLDTKSISIKDGSGVSRYNAINTDWMTSAMSKMNFDYETYLPSANQGTLEKRMRELSGSVFFKTGTLFGISSLAGIIKSDNKEYEYASIIMSYNRNKSFIKGVEDEIVYEIYRMAKDE